MKVAAEELIKIIVIEVLSELEKQGVKIDYSSIEQNHLGSYENKSVFEVNMSDYKSPVLTENITLSVPSHIKELIVPKGTVVTPGARETILKKKIKLIVK